MQFIASPDFAGPEGRLAHLGVMCEDLEAALAAAQKFGVEQMPQGRNWLRLPDGLAVEFIQASPAVAVAQALAVNPRRLLDDAHEKYWDDAKVGDECVSPTYTVTEERITGLRRPDRRPHARARRRGLRQAEPLRRAGRARPVRPVDRRRPEDAERLPLPARHVARLDWDFVGPIKVGDMLHVKFQRRQHARVEEQAGLGHRRAAVGADQPARRGGAEGRAPLDDSGRKRRRGSLHEPKPCRSPASASSTTATSWPARTCRAAWRRWAPT